MEKKFDSLELNHVLRKDNKAADALAKMAFERATVPSDVFVSDLHKPSVDHKEDGGMGHSSTNPASSSEASATPKPEAMDIEPKGPTPDDLPDYRFLYLQFLVDGTLHLDQAKARRLACHAKAFILINGELYKRSRSGVLMRCITHQDGTELLHDIHSGACAHHATTRMLVGNAFHQGF